MCFVYWEDILLKINGDGEKPTLDDFPRISAQSFISKIVKIVQSGQKRWADCRHVGLKPVSLF